MVQPDPLVGDTSTDKSGESPAGKQKEVAEEKTSSASAVEQSVDLQKTTVAAPDVDQSMQEKLQEETKQSTEGADFYTKEISESQKFLTELAKQAAAQAQRLHQAGEGLRLSMEVADLREAFEKLKAEHQKQVNLLQLIL